MENENGRPNLSFIKATLRGKKEKSGAQCIFYLKYNYKECPVSYWINIISEIFGMHYFGMSMNIVSQIRMHETWAWKIEQL